MRKEETGPVHAAGPELPSLPRGDGEPRDLNHVVQFYEDDAFLCETVARFIGAGIAAGEPVVIIATDLHRQAFVQRLKANHIDVTAAVDAGRLALLDARETLASFLVDGIPDWERFQRVVGGTLAHVAKGRAHVRAYGEMVDLLWRDGKAPAAIRLEEMWNDLGRHYNFSLLCAYVMGNFYKEDDAQLFEQICRTHAHVFPTESYAKLEDSKSRLREVSVLQQRARALQTEVERRRRVEERLAQLLADQASRGAQSEQRFQLLVESVSDYAIFMLDPKGIVSSWNVGAERIKGFRADEIIGQHFSRFYPREDVLAGKCEHELEVAARVGRFEDEGWRVRRDGSRFWANVIISRMLNAKGELVGFGKVTRDLTERRKLELEQVARAAAEAEGSRLHQLFLQAPVAIALSRGPEHVLELANEACCAMLGRTEQELVGKTVRAAFCDLAGDAAPFAMLDRIYQSGERFHAAEIPTQIVRDGRREDVVLRCAIQPLRDKAGAIYGLMSVAIEVTAEVRARETLEWTLAEQKRADELREQLIGIVGHDLRSPLSAITMATRLMMKRGTLTETDLKSATLIARNGDRMTKMISQLLDFTRSRLGGGIPIHPQPMALGSLCAELIAECHAANPSRQFSFDPGSDANGMWDRDRLAQVIANLLGNAVQYGTPNTPITMGIVDEGDNVALTVHNDGPPIQRDVLPVIFEPFRRGRREQATEKTESLGLGLFIASEIVRAHGGRIAVRSTEAEGTTFTVRLPRLA